MVIDDHSEQVIGKTPLTRANVEWATFASYELRLPGYRPQPVSRCGGDVIHLTRAR